MNLARHCTDPVQPWHKVYHHPQKGSEATCIYCSKTIVTLPGGGWPILKLVIIEWP